MKKNIVILLATIISGNINAMHLLSHISRAKQQITLSRNVTTRRRDTFAQSHSLNIPNLSSALSTKRHFSGQTSGKSLENMSKRKTIIAGLLMAGVGYSYIHYQKFPAPEGLEQKPSTRPAHIQEQIDEHFECGKDYGNDWGRYRGSEWYGLLDIDEEILLQECFSSPAEDSYLLGIDEEASLQNYLSPLLEKENIYIIDVGGANGAWSQNAMDILQGEKYTKTGKHFHIFSITGSRECDERVWTKDNVTLYQFNQFKIENIDEEFSKRGFDLKNKVHLIVSRWTLRHLVDPFGTLEKMYGLLTPTEGKLLCNGFLFKYDFSDEIQGFPDLNEDLLSHSNASSIIQDYRVGRDCGRFLLMRTNKKSLAFPIGYTGTTTPIPGYAYQCQSSRVTNFSKTISDKNMPYHNREYVDSEKKLYCVNGDGKCKELYAYLKQNKFLN